MGLNLLCLLALGRNAEFHVSVEKLPADILQKNPYIRHPVQLEQFIMEGNYNKVSSNLSSKLTHIKFLNTHYLNHKNYSACACVCFLGYSHERQRPVEVLHVLHQLAPPHHPERDCIMHGEGLRANLAQGLHKDATARFEGKSTFIVSRSCIDVNAPKQL